MRADGEVCLWVGCAFWCSLFWGWDVLDWERGVGDLEMDIKSRDGLISFFCDYLKLQTLGV